MADVDIQALLDADANGRGIRIVKRTGDTGTLSHYVCEGNVLGYPGGQKVVSVTTTNTDAQKNTAIRAAFGI